MSRIAVIGAGNIGTTIGNAWREAGHEVALASREPQPPETVATDEALAGAEVVLLALPGGAVEGFLDEHGGALEGRLMIDATNRPGERDMHNAETLATRSPGARYVRAFNTLGWEVLAEATEAEVELFWCGPDGADGELVEELIAAVGLRPVRAGGLEAIDAVDGIGKLWMTLVFGAGLPRTIAFRLVGASRKA